MGRESRKFSENGLADKGFVLEMITSEDFVILHQTEEQSIFVVDDKVKFSDNGIRRDIIKKYRIEPKEVCSFEKSKSNEILNQLKQDYSIRQIERVTGISRGVIQKC